MLDKFWNAVGEKLGGQWIAALLQPALAFWAVGLLAWVHRQPDGWGALLDWWQGLGSTEAQVAVLVGALLGILASSAVMQWAQGWLLRVLEGYWPRWARFASRPLCERVCARLEPKLARWQALEKEVKEVYGGDPNGLRPADREEYVRLDREVILLHPPTDTPPQPENVLPTALGNRLKAAESHAEAHYGLDAVVAWPRLWPLLPEGLRVDVAEARARLNTAVRLLGWGVLACLWTLWAWWALPLGVAVAAVGWFRALGAAETYGDVLRTAFDLHRFDLYTALHWPLPIEAGAAERDYGQQLTKFLLRGWLEREPAPLVHPGASGKKGA